MKQAGLIFLGGGMGSVLRYAVALWLNGRITAFPAATLSVNILGALLMGLLLGHATQHPEFYRSNAYFVWATGFCGGFTTFSAFVIDQIDLLGKRPISHWFTYVILSVVVGLLMGYWGYRGTGQL